MTTPTTAPPQVPRRLSGPAPGQRHLRDVVRGVAALVALAGLVLGVPIALLTVAPLHLPGQLPTWSDITGAVMRPDDGTLFLAVLTVLAWVAWAAFCASTLVEAVAQARGLPAVRLPLLVDPATRRRRPRRRGHRADQPRHPERTLPRIDLRRCSHSPQDHHDALGRRSTRPVTCVGNQHNCLSGRSSAVTTRSSIGAPPQSTQLAQEAPQAPRYPTCHCPSRRHPVGTGRTPPRRRHPVHRDRAPQLRPSPARRRRPHPRPLDPPRLGPAAAHRRHPPPRQARHHCPFRCRWRHVRRPARRHPLRDRPSRTRGRRPLPGHRRPQHRPTPTRRRQAHRPGPHPPRLAPPPATRRPTRRPSHDAPIGSVHCPADADRLPEPTHRLRRSQRRPPACRPPASRPPARFRPAPRPPRSSSPAAGVGGATSSPPSSAARPPSGSVQVPGGWIGLPFAAALAALGTLVWLRRRRRYTPDLATRPRRTGPARDLRRHRRRPPPGSGPRPAPAPARPRRTHHHRVRPGPP